MVSCALVVTHEADHFYKSHLNQSHRYSPQSPVCKKELKLFVKYSGELSSSILANTLCPPQKEAEFLGNIIPLASFIYLISSYSDFRV